jgi:hypothetical protein
LAEEAGDWLLLGATEVKYSLATFALGPTGFQAVPFHINDADGEEAESCVVYIVNACALVFVTVTILPPVATVGFGSESACPVVVCPEIINEVNISTVAAAVPIAPPVGKSVAMVRDEYDDADPPEPPTMRQTDAEAS